MEKVVLTTYRKLFRMCRRTDGSVAMRTQLVCCPLQTYDHRTMEWETFDVGQMHWAESRTFLDGLIRRLNNGSPQYIPPLLAEATAAIETYRSQCTSVFAAEDDRRAQAAEASAAAAREGESDTDDSTTVTASESVRGSGIPINVLPHSKLTVALRLIFEETPFSMANLANAFAAVKELQYVCDLDDASRARLVTVAGMLAPPSAIPDATSTAASAAVTIPRLERALEVAPLHNSLINGLSAEQRTSLDQQMGGRTEDDGVPRSPAETLADATLKNAFDAVPSVGEAKADAAAASAPTAEATPATAAAPVDTLDADLPSAAELMEAPKQVQLLLSHPTSRGFFRRSVLLMVRHVTHESAAFVINKPLRNDEGLEMTIEATVRLGRVHPIFRQHLTQHTLMIGGPVMSGSSFDESIFLLHRVPGVPNALPLGAGLWMDGDLDALMAKLDAKEASAEEDVVVLCGFAGWGVEQLKGELDNGYWVVASGSGEDICIGSFVMSLAHTATASHHDLPPESPAPKSSSGDVPPVSAESGEDSSFTVSDPTAAGTVSSTDAEAARIREEAQKAADAALSRALPSLKARRQRQRSGAAGKEPLGARIETLSWVRAFASLGSPYAEMAMNQKAYSKDDDAP